ncbi:hypothetical protein Cgig2_025789 [Carnegiea gigantea]|uniref:Uncharacterized protein n=1 Tax=Carnegiea gigantea TaxID=171969 RepID=A0A9Q1GWY0_9CARY|nr:hypothetical protein Cgig2_025789 [Carnegiea gigantea]
METADAIDHNFWIQQCLCSNLLSHMTDTMIFEFDNSKGELSYKIRRFEVTNKSRAFIELSSQLAVWDSVSHKEFEDRFQELSPQGDDRIFCMLIRERLQQKVGHIEDVVVNANARGLQLGKKADSVYAYGFGFGFEFGVQLMGTEDLSVVAVFTEE